VIYLVVWSLVVFFAGLEIHADWSRKRMRKAVNMYHEQQHWLQLACGVVSLLESVDPASVFGINPYWLVGFLGALGGSCDAMILEISAHVLVSGYYALIRESPRWLVPLFVSIGMGYTLIHVPLQTMRGLQEGSNGLAFADTLNMAMIILISTAIIDVTFLRIRKRVIESDANTAASTKMLPRLMKHGRIILALNIALLGALGYALNNNIANPTSATSAPLPGIYKPTLAPVLRLVILLVTMWWTYHSPCAGSHKKELGHAQISSRTSRTKRSTTTAPLGSSDSRQDPTESSSAPSSGNTLGTGPDAESPAGSPRVSTCAVELAVPNSTSTVVEMAALSPPNSISVEISPP
jgi:hypothetical protein